MIKNNFKKTITYATTFSMLFSLLWTGISPNVSICNAEVTSSQNISLTNTSDALSLKIASSDNTSSENTSSEISTLEEAYAEASGKYNKAKEVYDLGSKGFFQDVNSALALSVLENNPISDKTHIGDADDATSLTNMKKVLDNIEGQIDSAYFEDTEDKMSYIEKCNYLRSKNNVNELKVTDYLMAVAQVDCNYSDTIIGHAGVFQVGENLAWNYASDPFYQWYDEEYAEFKNGNTNFSDIGHYKNIIDSSYKYTGFAICTRKSMYNRTTYGQTFSYSSNETAYSLSEYKTRFMNYYNKVVNALNEAKTQLDNSKTALYEAVKKAAEEAAKKAAEEEAKKAAKKAAEEEAAAKKAAEEAAAKNDNQTNSSNENDGSNNDSNTKKITTSSEQTFIINKSSSSKNTSTKTASVTFTSSKKNKSNIVIPATVTLNGKKYKVTSIAKNAFKNNKKLKKISIGKYIKTIGSKAFYNCKKLKKIIFKTKILKKVGKKAFKKIHKKAKYTYPKGLKNKYKKLIKKSNK